MRAARGGTGWPRSGIIPLTDRQSPNQRRFAVGTEMVTLLITAIAVLVLFGIGVYFWQKPATDDADNVLPPRPNARGLFEEEPSKATVDAERLALISQR